MAIKFNRSQTFATNGTVTAPGLHNLVDGLDIYQALITDQTNLTSVGTADELLIADADLTAADAPRAVTVQELFNDALTVGTYTDANFTANLTYGTATGNRTVSTTATISTATISTGIITSLTAGTTTSTAATITNGTITNGTITTALIPTLTAGTTTSTAEIVTSGTIATLNSTIGTIGTLRSTTGTITNLSTTLDGDFTISHGTGTLATSGATAGTYGSVTEIPFLTINAKGIITAATTGTFSSTPADGSITYAKLSTSSTEADNVAKRTAKAWVNFNGTTNTGGNCTIRDDFNVSTVADNATGSYTVNFSSPLTTSSYACVAQADAITAGGAHAFIYADSLGTSNFNLQVTSGAGSRGDATTVSAVVFL